MKKLSLFLKIAFLTLAIFATTVISTYAYYEFYGKYSNVININGTIKLDAFDSLYPELRDENQYGYGLTPENPYVIDNSTRLLNLIQLNNSGKLQRYKIAKGVDRLYFCLQFDTQEIPQILDLLNSGSFESIGNNKYPFEDELSGIVYAYELTTNNIVYLSGCLPIVEIKNTENGVLVNEILDASISLNTYPDGKYLKLEQVYDETLFNPNDPESIVFKTNAPTQYISVNDQKLKVIHQIIANENIVATTDQIDVGFINKIASGGYVHDIILYNVSISCVEDDTLETHNFLKQLFAGLVEGVSVSDHHFADSNNKSDERHIGIFAGHIDGEAANISVGGTSTINIDTPEVNYYSNYMTVGYIYDFAKIGGYDFIELSQDSFLDGGTVSGCLFADDIYASVASDAQYTTSDGAKHYALVNIASNTENKWPGVVDGEFSYGSFVFLLSSQDDTVSNIWNGNSELKLLGEEGYTITGSVLYCADEYRYSPDQQAGGSIIPSSASVKELLFSGISSLKSTGSVIDAGKYLIVAKVAVDANNGEYEYYAIKLKATDDGTGNPVYQMDASESANVTAFIEDETNTVSLYQSALWNVDTPSTTPVFENCRYEGQYITRNDTQLSFGTYNSNNDNYKLQYNATQNHLYYNATSGEITTQYYVSFNANDLTWSMSSNAANAATIEIYRVAKQFIVDPVTSVNDLEQYGDYLIVAKNNSDNKSYLLGIDYTNGTTSNKFASLDESFDTASFPTSLEVGYIYDNVTENITKELINYVWNVQSSNNGSISFVDKPSLTYFLTTSDGNLSLSTEEDSWAYTQNASGATLLNNEKYLSYTYVNGALETCFKTSDSSYTIYLYRIVPEDDTPLYITYEGAKYIDADSTTIDTGTYAIVGVNGNNNYALGITADNAITQQATNVTGASSLNGYYQWQVNTQTSTPTFQNVQTPARYLSHNNNTLAANTTSNTWMYDAQNYHVYYKNDNNTYYLVTNNNGAFSIVNGLGNTNYSYEVRLYKCLTQYQFNDVRIATGFTTYENNNPYVYIVSYTDLSDNSKSQFLVGYQMSSGSPIIDYYDFSDKYEIDGTITTTSNATIITRSEMLDYVWRYKTMNGRATQTVNNPRYTSDTFGLLYNHGYAQDGNNTNIYLCASNDPGSRSFSVVSGVERVAQQVRNGSTQISGFYADTANGNGSTLYPGVRIAFAGNPKRYYLTSGIIEGQFIFTPLSSNNGFPDDQYAANDVKPTFIYQSSGITPSNVLELISSNGDPLDQNIHYMITAEDDSSENLQYYALSMERDEENNVSFNGENVTSQVELIMRYGNSGFNGNINVPRNADWTQKSDNFRLRFYHTISSSNFEQNYISRSGSNLVMDLRESTASITDVSQFYYDIVNKVMKMDVETTTYYLTFNKNTKAFGLSTSANDAAAIHLIRFTPTYKVEPITDFDDDALKNGSFIVAGKTMNGYLALGTDGVNLNYSFNITNYLNEELAEDDYNSILQYVFKQVYYDYNTDEDYDIDASNGYVEFQLMTLAGTGGFAALRTNLTTYSSAYKWRIYRTNDGLWRFVNSQTDGDTTAGTRVINFSSGSGSSALSLNDAIKEIGDYVGEYNISTTTSNTSNNIYVYSPSSGERATTITNGSNYLLVAEAQGLKFAFANNNGNVEVVRIDNLELSSIISNNNFLWTINSFEEGYSISNNGYYAYFTNDGNVNVQNSLVEGCFIIENGLVSYRQYFYYYAYSSDAAAMTSSDNASNWTKICRYEVNGANYRFYPVNTNEFTTYSDRLVLVSKNDNNYYLINIGGANMTRSATLTNNTTYYQIAQNSITIEEYLVEVSAGNADNQYIIKSANTVYTYSSSANALSVSTNPSYWTKIYRYELSDTNYRLYPVNTNEFTTYSDRLVLVSYDGTRYYLLNIGGANIERTEVTNQGAYLQLANDNIDSYAIEISAGNNNDEYIVKAQGTYYAHYNNGMTTSNNANYWTKLYRFVINGANYEFLPVSTADISTYSDTLVLISFYNNNYYLLNMSDTTIQTTTLTNFSIARNTINLERYRVNVTAGGGADLYNISGGQKYFPATNGSTNNNNMTVSYDTTNYLKLYSYTIQNRRTTFEEITDISNYSDYTNLALVTKNGSNYYAIYYRSTTRMYLQELTMNSNGQLTYNGSLSDNYKITVGTNGNNKYSFMSRSRYLTINNESCYFTTRNATYIDYSNTDGVYYVNNTYYLHATQTVTYNTTNGNPVSYTDDNGIFYQTPYYYLITTTTQAGTSTTESSITYGDNGVFAKNNDYYLTASTNSAGRSTNQSSITYSSDRGVHTRTSDNYNSLLTCSSSFSAVSAAADASMIVVYENNNGTYTQVTGNLEVGKQYIILINTIENNVNDYYLIGYDNANGIIKLTPVGSTTSGFESLVNNSNYIDAYSAGVYGVSLRFNVNNRYLSIVNNTISTSTTVSNYWEYKWDPVYTTNSRLYTVEVGESNRVLVVNGNRIVPLTTGSETQVFSYTLTDGVYKVGTYVNANLVSGTSYVIVIYQDNRYYIVTNNDGTIVPTSSGSGFPTTISTNMLWTYNSANYFKPYGETGNLYLRTGDDGALTLRDNYTNSSWTYSHTGQGNGTIGFNSSTTSVTGYNVDNATPLYLFKVSMNDSLDAISDTYTTLKGKSELKASLSVLSSSNYIITATYNNRIYAMGMKNLEESIALDVTSTFNEALNGGYLRLFASAAWEQIGTDYNLIFDSLGFSRTYEETIGEETNQYRQYNLLSGAPQYLYEGSPTVIQMQSLPDNDAPFVWTLYSYGNNDYVLGNYNSGFDNNSFIYFDTDSLEFKVTNDETLAKTGGNKVSIYQLGAEVFDDIDFQTFKIEMEDDNVTIASYPLNEIEAKDIEVYNNQLANGTIEGTISGEYMILVRDNSKYYALALGYNGTIALADVTLLFNGNFSQDERGRYCISINTRYLWKQTGTVSYDANSGIASNLEFINCHTNTPLNIDGTTLSYGNGQLKSINNGYLNFVLGSGFSISNNESDVDILLYSVGADSTVIGEDSNNLSYSYYSSALNTNAVNYTNFSFQKVLIPNLVNYAKDETGKLTESIGWNLTATEVLESINSSVYFKQGINYSANLDTFKNEFEKIESTYETIDEESGEVVVHTINYYAPKGTSSFIIPEASSNSPVFINMIASTEQDPSINQNALRYLAIWKVADLVDDSLSPLSTTEAGGASDYASTLISKFYKPDNAIPLPNHTGSVASKASYVKNEETVLEEGQSLVTTTEYYLVNDANYNHLIAHSFCITSPGVYYIGSTYGTVTFCYLSIANMIGAVEGEINEDLISEDFSIDFVWGDIPTSNSGIDLKTDNGVGDLVYVTRRVQNDEALTWVHSNIYPKFINGTAGLYETSKPDGYNPTDKLLISTLRDSEVTDNVFVTTVQITARTTEAIDNEGTGITYSNMNNARQRMKRKVTLDIEYFN